MWYFTPEAYHTGDNYTYDYAVMVLGSAPGDETGWMSYVAISEDSLRDHCDANAFSQGQCFSRGYPACSLCTPEDDYPNGIRRLSPDVPGAISCFKSAMP